MSENDGHQHEWYWSPETGELRCKMCRASCDPIDRIAELERQHAAALAIVRAVAARYEDGDLHICDYCGMTTMSAYIGQHVPGAHTEECPIGQASALLAGETREEAGE